MRAIGRIAFGLLLTVAAGCSTPPEEEALALIEAYGGRTRTDSEGRIVAVDLSDTAAGDDVLAAVSWFPDVQSINCSNAPRISGHELAKLGRLPHLEELHLVHTGLDDAGLAQLQHVPSLRTLQLGHTKITDSGMPALDHLANLETLSLSGTAVSDLGLIQLRDLRKLSTLVVRDTNTTPRGILALRRSLPGVRVVD